ncbi:autotransporter assembly complex protein TamA [Falsirhodobacter deserti]|uniref:autotransporter assembly complex protein TamA n=1 Tax=Falsirhodobacter deserti TaxID=1365611 RepID=UPI001F4E77AB|nr:autotransporter assembly complex family protein [Falsirhodobacter deserti]
MAGIRALTLAATLGLTTAGGAHALDRVVFQVVGNDEDLTETLRGASLTAEVAEDPDRHDELFGAAQADYGRLIGAMYGVGRYSPVIHITIDGREVASIQPLNAPDPQSIREIRFLVDPGPEFRFSRAVVTPYVEGTEFPDDFRDGAVAESGLIADAARAGAERWREEGHAKVAVAEERITADHLRDTLSAEVRLAPGPRLRFGEMKVRGQKRMDPRRIEKIAGLPEGEVYSPEDLETAGNRLRRTGIFSSVTMTEGDVLAPDLLPITTTVVEQLPRRYSLGAEISSSEGAALTGYWLHRNLLGGGERLRVDAAIENIAAQNSGMDYSQGVALERPATPDADTTAGVNARIEHLDEEDYTSDGVTLGLSFNRIISEELSTSLGLTYSYSDVTDDLGEYTFKTLALPLGVVWDTRDDDLDATGGVYVNATAQPFAGSGDADSGFRATMDARGYYSLGTPRRVTLAGRVQAGQIFGTDLLNTPRDYLFYSGGGGTVRGQPYQSLGVYPSADDPDYKIGGAAFLAASVEARVMVTDNIGVVGFFDAGRVGADGFSDMQEQSGAGLGIRYDTGVGPIRLDVAAPVSGGTGEGVQIYVGIGQAF